MITMIRVMEGGGGGGIKMDNFPKFFVTVTLLWEQIFSIKAALDQLSPSFAP